MRSLRPIIAILALALVPGCVIAAGPAPYYSGGHGYSRPYAHAPVYRPYYAPPRHGWGHGYSQGYGHGRGPRHWR